MPFQAPEDICNDALTRLGVKRRLASLYEGSPASKAFLDVFGQTRDDLLREGDWDFAKTSVALTVLKVAPPGGYIPPVVWTPANPPPPWRFVYAYPPDAIKIGAIRPTPIFSTDDMDPQPTTFSVASDPTNGKVILCDIPSAIMTYTTRVIDPTQWEPGFIEALAASLARRVAPMLVGGDAAKMEVGDETQADSSALAQQG